MSYELYCYKPKSGSPNIEEGRASTKGTEISNKDADPTSKLKIAEALRAYNPRLQPFIFDYEEIAELQDISVNEAMDRFNYIEINPPEEDLAIQITAYDERVVISVPYWYSGYQADEVFKAINEYIQIITAVATYFVFDPQTDAVYDPQKKDFSGLRMYTDISRKMNSSMNKQQNLVKERPWWQFW